MFDVGAKYTRRQVLRALGVSDTIRGGNWFTGYNEHQDSFFIFTNVGTPGRTGHDYGNRWEGPNLRWFAKTETSISQPQIARLVSGDYPVHVFWRGNNAAPFEYSGQAHVLETRDTSPVEVLWGLTADPSPVAGPRSVSYWALLANPRRYRILDAVNSLDRDTLDCSVGAP